MNKTAPFPIEFRSLRSLSGGKHNRYLVAAMFTAEYAAKACRLADSCEKFDLPYVLHEVPTIHKSISARGTDDLAYTKANFIRHLIADHGKSVLYVDADCEFASRPDLIQVLVDSRCDFAIYNWLADPYTDVFLPFDRSSVDRTTQKARFYRFVHSIDWFAMNQLRCSGLVQFYRNSMAARSLLWKWQQTIANFPECADDQALDFTFNNLERRTWLWWMLKVRWLPKSYARICWWIYAKPVINHPDFPGTGFGFKKIQDPSGRKDFYRSRAKPKTTRPLLPRDCIIDTQERMLCRLVDGQIIPLEPTSHRFWL